MKKIFRKNQIIITALALMIAVAGYINYSDNIRNRNKSTKNTATTCSEILILPIFSSQSYDFSAAVFSAITLSS